MPTHYLAIDLGAESGRVMIGTLAEGRFALEEVHRFANTPVQVEGALTWNIPALFHEIQSGLRKAAAHGLPLSGLSVDSWGVDYMLFDEAGEVLPPTFHYRDARSARGVENATAHVDLKTVFEETGIQFMALNTIFQLAAESPKRLDRAAQMLTIADGFHRLLCGVACIDESNASTTQLYNPRTRQWSKVLIDALRLPERMFPRIVPCGSRLGPLSAEIARSTGLASLDVIASCSHDTGAAVAAVPAMDGDWVYISSGTWSLMGVELASPVITEACREFNFTNEIGYGSTVRLLKNIVGLWLVQECRREWTAAGEYFEYAALTKLAAEAAPFVSLINPADARFIAPGQMPGKIAAFCRETGQPEPATPGATVRCALESLALLYRRTLRQLEQLLGKRLDRVHLIGGGSRNALLNQLTANALQIPVVAGPAEATALGNIAVQALALGHLPSLAAAREVIRASFELMTYEPESAQEWERQLARFDQLPVNPGHS
jgi:rhamnulokinase